MLRNCDRVKVFDAILGLTFVTWLTGGVVFYKQNHKPLFEIADLSFFAGILAVFMVWCQWRQSSLESLFKKSRVLQKFHYLLSKPYKHQQVVWMLVMLGILLFCALLAKHYSLHTGFDTAIFDQALFNTSHGRLHWSWIKNDRSLFADHFQPILLLIAPLYSILSTPIWLYAIQSASLLAAIVAGSQICQHLQLNAIWKHLLIICLCTHRLYRGVLINDFHPIALIVPIFLLLILAILQRQTAFIVIFSLLALTVKEHIGLYIAFFSILQWSQDHSRKGLALGLFLMLVGLGHYVAVNQWLMPYFGQEYSYAQRYQHLGSNLYEIVLYLLDPFNLIKIATDSLNIRYVLYFFGGLAFLSCASGRYIWLLAPFLAQNLLSNTQAQKLVGGTHYAAEGIALLFFTAAVGASKVQTYRYQHRAVFAALWCVILFHGRSDAYNLRQHIQTLSRYSQIIQVKKLVSDQKVLALQHCLLPHFSSRQTVYLAPHSKRVDAEIWTDDCNSWPLEADAHNARISMLRQQAVKVEEDKIDGVKIFFF